MGHAPFAPLRVTLKSAFRRLKSALGLDVYRRPEVSVETVRLGDPGGRWGIAPGALGAGTVYAFGVGTDISFERDLIARCGVTVHAFDPTPIALEWAAAQRLPERFVLHPYGVADFDGTARFAAPRKRKFASFSMVRQEGVGPAVEAPVHRLTTLIDMLRLPPPDVLKLDIEGAEYAVLADLLAGAIRPAADPGRVSPPLARGGSAAHSAGVEVAGRRRVSDRRRVGERDGVCVFAPRLIPHHLSCPMLRLNTFGGLVLQQDGQLHTGPASQRRRLALLAVVAAAGPRGVSRDKLLALLWPDSEAEAARHSLYQAVHAIRRSAGSDEIFLGGTTLQLNPQLITSDVGEFEEAVETGSHEQAVRLYRGPFLDGFRLESAPEYEQWQDGERVLHARQYATALESLAAEAAARGDHPAAVRWWRRLAAAEPVSTTAAVGLIEDTASRPT